MQFLFQLLIYPVLIPRFDLLLFGRVRIIIIYCASIYTCPASPLHK